MENQSRISDLLQSALDDLLEEDFKRFKDKLSHSDFKGKGTIPRGRLEKADRIDTKNNLIAFYGGDAAVDVTIEILAKINVRGSAANLKKYREKDLHPNGKPLELSAKGEHFVNQHRADLIQRVCMVDSIIDMLYGTVLDEEQYQSIRAEKTNPDKMRKLYEFMPSWNWYCKEQLYQALKAKNKFLIEELESK
ncbi:apoptosis-associated speck-like protein containing a CARD isoform X2 [Trachemys scripta elegans]|uniref:apoptosis-associated speck-like protein containing a CARD isoform X2 n=1 Tax=Trachemys scripta elegans TaxID=31138 RepID=UPI001553CE9C|nr:apoptosis-associated speck-like protein containing a CARD isoform X2 [Trachemys scripta elegans]